MSINTNHNHSHRGKGKIMKDKNPTYEAPQVITYSEDEIIEMLGPAQTCSPSPCPTYQ